MTPRRRRIIVGLLFTSLVLGIMLFLLFPWLVARIANGTRSVGPYPLSAEAKRLHEQLFVVDLHADSLLWNRDLLERGSWGHVDVPRMLEGRLALQAFTVVTMVPNRAGFEDQPRPTDIAIKALVVAQGWPRRTWSSLHQRALYQAERLHALARRSEGRFRVIETRAELTRLRADHSKDGKVAAGFLGIEGAQCLEGRVDNLEALFAAGFRMIGPTHFFDTALGGSAHGVSGGGLTEFGRQVITRMEELGMIVDLAHASSALIDDVLALAKKPVLASHTGVRGTHDSVRNLSDAQLQGIARSGGVIGIAFFEDASGGTDIAAIIRAIRHTVDQVGIDHVALGSDFDGAVTMPFHCGGLGKITEALLEAGFKDTEVRKIMGENTLRVLMQTLPEK